MQFSPSPFLTSRNSVLIRGIRRTGWTLSLALVLLLLQSAFWSDRVPWILAICVGATTILAAVRPAEALLVVAGFVPLSHAVITRIWDAWPFGLGEALALGFLAGYLWRQRRFAAGERPPGDGLTLPAYSLALIIVASALVQLAVLQVWHDYPLKYILNFMRFLTTDYLTTVPDSRPSVDGRGFVGAAALMVEGIALMLCARTLCREQPSLGRRLTTVIVAAGVGAAALSVFQVAEEVLATNESLSEILEGRWSSPAIPSPNISAAYFALVAFVAFGAAVTRSPHRVLKFLAGALCLLAMWLTQTRAAVVASLAVASAAGVWLSARKLRIKPIHAVLLVGLAAVAVGIVTVAYDPFEILASGGGEALRFRIIFAETALKMIVNRPIFGVGVGQYYSLSRVFGSEELLDVHRYSNAHNQFLRLGAELGLIGLAVFLWLLGAALMRVYSRLRAQPSDYWLLGIVAGLSALMITWLSREVPYPQAAFTFWILFGVAVAHAADGGNPVTAPRKRSVFSTVALLVAGVVLIGSVPIRVRLDIASRIDMASLTYGVYGHETDALGTPFRWIGPRATFFIPASVRTVDVPIAAVLNIAQPKADVEILVSDRPAHRMTLTDKNWHRVRLRAPADDEPFWRLEFRVTPSWVPRDTLPNSGDRRELGVRVGEIVRRP